MRATPLLFTLAIACIPTIPEPDAVEDDSAADADLPGPWGGDADDAEDGQSEDGGDGPDDDAPDDDGDRPDDEPDDGGSDTPDGGGGSTVRLQSGLWDYARRGVSLQDDPCGWADILESSGGLIDFMPTEFTVDGRAGSFDILAGRYGRTFGADAPVDCAIAEDGSFRCETQTVRPRDGLLGDFGWLYTVDFDGQVVDAERIEGTAVVRFRSVDDGTLLQLESVGIDFGSCTQVVDLTLTYQPDALDH